MTTTTITALGSSAIITTICSTLIVTAKWCFPITTIIIIITGITTTDIITTTGITITTTDTITTTNT